MRGFEEGEDWVKENIRGLGEEGLGRERIGEGDDWGRERIGEEEDWGR